MSAGRNPASGAVTGVDFGDGKFAKFFKAFGISCTGKGELLCGGTANFVLRQTVTLFRTPFRGANGGAAPVEIISIQPILGSSAFDFREVPGH